MSGENERRHNYLNLNLEGIVPWYGGGDRQAFCGALAVCDRWISDHVIPTPSHADREEIMSFAFLAVLQGQLFPCVSPEVLRNRLKNRRYRRYRSTTPETTFGNPVARNRFSPFLRNLSWPGRSRLCPLSWTREARSLTTAAQIPSTQHPHFVHTHAHSHPSLVGDPGRED